MLKILSANQMKEIDRKAAEELKIPDILLMENAGRSVYDKIADIISSNNLKFCYVSIICGKGNNGGDGFSTARHLIENGIQTTVISLFKESDLSHPALVNHNILKHFTEIAYLDEIGIDKLRQIISDSTIVIDAVLGTGLNSQVNDNLKNIINSINEYSEGYVVSADIPSGISADTGEVLGSAVVADYTVTFHALKNGLVCHPGAGHAGEITVSPIGIPAFLTNSDEFNAYLITPHYINISLPLREQDSHKWTFGRVFNVA